MPNDKHTGNGRAASSTSSSPHVSVLVADGQRLLAEALGRALLAEPGIGVVSGHPTTTAETLECVERTRPDVVLADYWMPGNMLGPTLIRSLGRSHPSTRLLATSWWHGPVQVEAAFAAGAAGFLPKSLSIARVVEAIRRAGAGEEAVFHDELHRLVQDIDHRTEADSRHWERLASLSPRERQVLALLAKGRSQRQLAEELFISEGTARRHVENILRKTGTNSGREAARLLEGSRGFEPEITGGVDWRGHPRLTAPKSPGISVVVVDEQRTFAEAVGRAIDPEVDVRAVHFGTGHESLRTILAVQPDVVLFDYWMRGVSGPAASRYLSDRAPRSAMILVSHLHGRREVREAHAAGALALVPKRISVDELVATVRSAREGIRLEHAERAPVTQSTAPDEGREERWAALRSLTLRELEVLRQLSRGWGREDIAAALGISAGTVKNHIRAILAKTGCVTTRAAVLLARQEGLLGP